MKYAGVVKNELKENLPLTSYVEYRVLLYHRELNDKVQYKFVSLTKRVNCTNKRQMLILLAFKILALKEVYYLFIFIFIITYILFIK